MREALFVKNNYNKWKEFEELINQKKGIHPDKLADLFIHLTDDLAFARTHYPKSQTTQYLNQLAANVHQAIYKNKKEKESRFITFWLYELPLLFRSAHKQLLYSFLIFSVSVLIGVVSTEHDETFVRLIMGDSYVNMTMENIEKGDPMAVYKSMDQFLMFLRIAFNNIMVTLRTFASGVITSLGTVFILFHNGVMLGSFQYFFHKQDLLLDSFLTIWIHGTLEISAIIIAGAAGLVMGNSILFPGTYTRLESFKRGALKGIKIIVGVLPIILFAAFLESFVTRLDLHWAIKLSIILASAIFIVYYFIIYPIQLSKHAGSPKNH